MSAAILSRPLAVVAATLLVVVVAYWKGGQDTAQRFRLAAAEAEAEFADKSTAAAEAAFLRGLEASRQEKNNAVQAERVVEVARREPGASNICVSAAVLNELRALQ